MPPILTAIFMAALASALMRLPTARCWRALRSSPRTCSCPCLAGGSSPTSEVKWTRIMVGVSALVAVVIAMTAATIYELGVVAWTFLLVGLFSPFALGMYWKRNEPVGGRWQAPSAAS